MVPADKVKNLGVIFDSDNSYSSHITSVCRACYYHLHDLHRIRKYLTLETAVLVANAMVSSRLDYCNSLLYGISKANITKLQRVQNALCHTVYKLNRLSHVSTCLNKLHWLPIEQRILFKYNLLLFKAIKFNQPPYLSFLIRSSSLTWGIAYPSPHTDPADNLTDKVLLLLPLSNGTSCPRLSDHRIRSVVSAVNLKHIFSHWHIPLPSSSLAGRSHKDDCFCASGFPFLNTSTLEDVFINSVLYKCFYYYYFRAEVHDTHAYPTDP